MAPMIDITSDSEGTLMKNVISSQGITLPTIRIFHARLIVDSFYLSQLMKASNFYMYTRGSQLDYTGFTLEIEKPFSIECPFA